MKSIGIFANTPDSALASVASIVEPMECSAGDPIIRKGEVESCMYLIARGRVRVHDGSAAIAELGEGEIIGEMALLDPAPRSASATVMDDSLLLRLEKDAFDAVMADNPEIVQGVIRVLCQRLRKHIGVQ
jgi:CRP/FNR family cyclic AMP-dependent transcriptional regulator